MGKVKVVPMGKVKTEIHAEFAPLSEAALSEIDRALRSMEEASMLPHVMGWALAASWSFSGPDVIHCLVTTTHFVVCGGRGWGLMGYDPAFLSGKPWSEFLVDPSDVSASNDVVARNVSEDTGVEGFENRYRHADGTGVSRVVWRISPWRDGYAVARGVVNA